MQCHYCYTSGLLSTDRATEYYVYAPLLSSQFSLPSSLPIQLPCGSCLACLARHVTIIAHLRTEHKSPSQLPKLLTTLRPSPPPTSVTPATLLQLPSSSYPTVPQPPPRHPTGPRRPPVAVKAEGGRPAGGGCPRRRRGVAGAAAAPSATTRLQFNYP